MPSASSAGSVPPPATLADLLPCQRGGGEMWFSELPDELEQAKVRCQQCPLRTACLSDALERAEPCGVWGGEILHQGAIIARKRPRGRPPRTRPDAGKGHRGRPTAQAVEGVRSTAEVSAVAWAAGAKDRRRSMKSPSN
jgi:WhiB family transcriptional regulator, redox-sensing transcriptional regulator